MDFGLSTLAGRGTVSPNRQPAQGQVGRPVTGLGRFT